MTDGYGYGGSIYAGSPYAYDGYYDGFYGPIYDGYWGTDNYFYYRSGAHERRYRRGDSAHFHRGDRGPGSNFRPMQGSMTPGRGIHTPHFPRGDAASRPGRPDRPGGRPRRN